MTTSTGQPQVRTVTGELSYLDPRSTVLRRFTAPGESAPANYFRITGPKLSTPLQTNLFTVSGKIASLSVSSERNSSAMFFHPIMQYLYDVL